MIDDIVRCISRDRTDRALGRAVIAALEGERPLDEDDEDDD